MLAMTKPTSPTPSSLTSGRLRREDADLFDVVVLLRRHQPDLLPGFEHAVDHAHEVTTPR